MGSEPVTPSLRRHLYALSSSQRSYVSLVMQRVKTASVVCDADCGNRAIHYVSTLAYLLVVRYTHVAAVALTSLTTHPTYAGGTCKISCQRTRVKTSKYFTILMTQIIAMKLAAIFTARKNIEVVFDWSSCSDCVCGCVVCDYGSNMSILSFAGCCGYQG